MLQKDNNISNLYLCASFMSLQDVSSPANRRPRHAGRAEERSGCHLDLATKYVK